MNERPMTCFIIRGAGYLWWSDALASRQQAFAIARRLRQQVEMSSLVLVCDWEQDPHSQKWWPACFRRSWFEARLLTPRLKDRANRRWAPRHRTFREPPVKERAHYDLGVELIKELERYATYLNLLKGSSATTSDVVRAILYLGLEALAEQAERGEQTEEELLRERLLEEEDLRETLRAKKWLRMQLLDLKPPPETGPQSG